MASTIPRTIPFVLGSSGATATAPTAPTGLSSAARSGGAQVTWTAPAGVTDYTLVASGASVVARRYAFTAGSPVAISGLVNGVAYTLSLVARNAVGSSPAATVTVTPSAAAAIPGADGTVLVTPAAIAPAAPTLGAVTPFDGSAVATWAAPLDDGGSPVTGYSVVVTTVADGTAALTVQAGAGASSVTLAPLLNGVQYAVTVAASNGVGTSQPTDPTLVTPTAGLAVITPPDAPVVTVHTTLPEPMWEAFPVDRVFHPDNWLLTAEEVDAL